MRYLAIAGLASLAMLAGCGKEPAASSPPGLVATGPAPAGPVAAPTPAPPPTPPPGYRPMVVAGVHPELAGGRRLVLVDGLRTIEVPMFIGDTEGDAIARRLARERYERPLTHDLLDEAIRRLGGSVIQVEVGELRDSTFIATLVLWDGQRLQRIDARSSDAIAVALGHGAPIYVSEAVVTRTGVPPTAF